MGRWKSNQYAPKFRLLGKLGDVVDFRDLPSSVQSEATAAAFGSVGSRQVGKVESCGSAGEVPNSPTAGHRYAMQMLSWSYESSDKTQYTLPLHTRYSLSNGKSMVHNTLALNAPDQLRQRMAWALSQVFVIGVSGLDKEDQMEPWFAFYEYVLLRLDSPPHTGNRRRTRTRAFLLTVCH